MSDNFLKISKNEHHHLSQKTRVILLGVLLCFTFVLGITTYAAAKLREPYLSYDEERLIDIERGMSTRAVAAKLEDENIIQNDKFFLYYVWIKKASGQIQAGQYQLSGSMTIPEIVTRLTNGEVVPNEVRLRIGEGWNLANIAQAIENSGLGSAEEFYALAGQPVFEGQRGALEDLVSRYNFLNNLPEGASLEGYLFPDTYIISLNGGVEELIDKSLRNFARKLNGYEAQAQAQGKSLHEIIVMASLVEGEAGRNAPGQTLSEEERAELEEERRKVSSVFWNRLEIGMKLQSDATVRYFTGKNVARAYLEDTQIDHVYNTYFYEGLPPGPINNPSLAAIEAALNPSQEDYFYFLSDARGKMYFARTHEEHVRNRQYLPPR